MMISRRDLLATAFAAALVSGCGTSPPGAGFTNGEKATFTADEKPGVRDDLQMPTNADSGDAKLAGSAADIPDPGSTGQPANPPSPTPPQAKGDAQAPQAK